MYYFIPSWYAQKGAGQREYLHPWMAGNDPWYRPTSASFDDTVGQIRMFRAAGEEVCLISLCYAPQERRFLHRQNIYPIDVISVFDLMQGIQKTEPEAQSYRSLSVPNGTEWLATSTCRIGMLGGQEYIRVEFGEDGNFLWAEYRNDGVVLERDYYDDRGFCSLKVRYRGGRPAVCRYLNDREEVQFTEDLRTGKITIEPSASYPFEQKSYSEMSQLIEEVLGKIVSRISVVDIVILAADARHDEMVIKSLRGQKLVLSYFGNRFAIEQEDVLQREVGRASMIVTDTERSAREIQDHLKENTGIYDISPFDTRLSLGKSQRIRELKVFMPFDGLQEPYLSRALLQVFSYMKENRDVVLLVGTKEPSLEDRVRLREHIEEVLQREGIDDLKFAGSLSAARSGDIARLVMMPYLTENDVIKILYDTRLILDVRDQPDLYLQIAGISAGIPQINYRFTRYVTHLKDGYIIQNINYVSEALEYYLSGLAHWNEALIYCVQEIEKYTGGSLVSLWKERLNAESEI